VPALPSPFAAYRHPLYPLDPGGHLPGPLAEPRVPRKLDTPFVFLNWNPYTHARVCVSVHVHARRRRHAKASCHHHRHSPSPLPPPAAAAAASPSATPVFSQPSTTSSSSSPPPTTLLLHRRPPRVFFLSRSTNVFHVVLLRFLLLLHFLLSREPSLLLGVMCATSTLSTACAYARDISVRVCT